MTTGLATTHIHLMSGSRTSGALPTISRSDAATEAAYYSAGFQCCMKLIHFKLTIICCEEQSLTRKQILNLWRSME
jgi:hypothetical protein